MLNNVLQMTGTEIPEITEEEQIRMAIRESLVLTREGFPKITMRNLAMVLEHDPLFEGAIRKNLLNGRPDISRPMPWKRTGTLVSDDDFAEILLFISREYGLECGTILKNGLKAVANGNQFHPIQDCLNALEWDGVSRTRNALHHFLGAEANDTNEEFLRVFMFEAIHRVFHPGCKIDYMLCVVGEQGAGKSTFFRFMAIKDEWFSDALGKMSDDNIYRWLCGHWLIEMSEMVAVNRAASIEETKAFLTRQKDVYKAPYDIFAEDHPRQCVFCGSSNRMDFLPRDRSGNRRFLPVLIDPTKAECHILADEAASRAYIEQLWAEVMADYKAGRCQLDLSPEGKRQQAILLGEYTQEDTKAGQIISYMELSTAKKLCSMQLFSEALGRGMEAPKDYETREICEIVSSAIASGELKGWRRFTNPRHFGKYGKQKGWERYAEAATDRLPEQLKLPALEHSGLTPMDDLPDLPF